MREEEADYSSVGRVYAPTEAFAVIYVRED